MPEKSEILPSGLELHGYRLQKLIGGGGFSLVYLAHRVHDEFPVVIKEYHSAKSVKRQDGHQLLPVNTEAERNFRRGIRQFFSEASTLSRVNHPNIVRVIDIFRENNTVYMVMEYQKGQDMRALIKRYDGQLSERLIRTVFPRLLHGLGRVHDMSLLHLDVKPANILLRRGGNPLLLDFGAAHNMSVDGEYQAVRTMTRGFAPIEQHENTMLGPWTDIYALGATIYACMTGEPPPVATKRIVQDQLNLRTRSLTKRYRESLLDALEWALRVQPEDRPRSTGELIEFFDRMDREEVFEQSVAR